MSDGYNPKRIEEPYRYAYTQGYRDAENGYPDKGDFYFPPSGHERCTMHEDELNFAYYCGYNDYDKV